MSSRQIPSAEYRGLAGKPVTIQPWVESTGPTGRRQIIDAVRLRCDYDIDVADAVLQGENLCRFFMSNVVSDLGGGRQILSGEGLRLEAIRQLGPARFIEAADVAIGNGATGRAEILVLFAKPQEVEPTQTSWPAEEFKHIKVTAPTAADLSLGASNVTINSLSYSAVAYCHEEDDVEFKVRDVLEEVLMETATQARVPVLGSYLSSIVAFKSGDALTSLANFTAHTITPIQPDELTAADYVELYRMMYAAGSFGTTPGDEIYGDPHLLDKARIIWLPPTVRRLKTTDLPFIAGAVTVKATNTVEDVQMLVRRIVPRHTVSANQVAAGHGLKLDDLYVKTPRGKVAQSQFGKLTPFMPLTT